jgi:hypothetical protein
MLGGTALGDESLDDGDDVIGGAGAATLTASQPGGRGDESHRLHRLVHHVANGRLADPRPRRLGGRPLPGIVS